eukprot:m.312169 g.312169  ORF g.312169 m.312169 type:complete len:62 (-) comp20236_c0_seq1:21-206(-)
MLFVNLLKRLPYWSSLLDLFAPVLALVPVSTCLPSMPHPNPDKRTQWWNKSSWYCVDGFRL